MRKSFFIFILAAAVASSAGLPLQAAGLAMDKASEAAMAMDDCANCDECDENSAMPTSMPACDNACLSACAAGASMAAIGHPALGEMSPTTLVYDIALRDRVASISPANDLPPPRA